MSDADDMISSYITKPWQAQSPVSTGFISTTSDLLERSMLSSLFFELFCNDFFHTTEVWGWSYVDDMLFFLLPIIFFSVFLNDILTFLLNVCNALSRQNPIKTLWYVLAPGLAHAHQGNKLSGTSTGLVLNRRLHLCWS